MARLARQDLFYNGCYAHVISRSIRKLKLFKDKEDFNRFKELIESTKRRSSYQIYHYCIMQTHFHFAVSIPNVQEFSNAIRHIKSRYSFHFHTKYRLSGPIWRERYKGLLIEDEAYLRICGGYIENNPVKAELVERAEDWQYSSARHYIKGKKDPIIDDYAGYSRHIKEDIALDDEKFFEKGKVIGSPFFRFQFYDSMK